MKVLQSIVYWLFVFCLPVVLITSTICWEVNELRLYEYGFVKYEISDATGIDVMELKNVAVHLIDYFNLDADSAQITVLRKGQEFNLFNERELIHLEDVRGLIQLNYRVQMVALLLVIICVLVLFFVFKVDWRRVVNGLLRGSLVTVGLMICLALWAFFGFERFFLIFHLVSFSNEYWMLDPSRDYLIRLFPAVFFYDAALLGFGAIILKAVIIGGIAFGVLRSKAGRR